MKQTFYLPAILRAFLLAGLFFCIPVSSSFAQKLHVDYTRLVGGYGFDAAFDAIYDPRDKSIVFTGYTDSCGSGDIPQGNAMLDRANVLVGKIDSNRNLAWVKVYGGSNDEAGGSIITTVDGGYMVFAHTLSTNGDVVGNHPGGANDVWLLKLDALGNKQWAYCYGSDYDEQLAGHCIQTKDKGYLVIATSSGSGGDVPSQYVNSQFTTDWFLLKTDSVGNKQWARTLGGTGYEEWGNVFEVNNGYYLVGSSASHDHECTDNSWHPASVNTLDDYILMRLDSQGNHQWTHSYGGSVSEQVGGAIFDDRDSSFVIAGRTNSYDYMVPVAPVGRQDIWLVKTDLAGNRRWSKILGDTLSDDYPHIAQMAQGDYLVTDQVTVNMIPAPPGYYGGGYDQHLFLIDSGGHSIADKVIGGIKAEPYWSIPVPMPGKNFCVVGTTSPQQFAEGTTSPGHGTYTEAFISYINYWPLQVQGLSGTTDKLSVYPNPAEHTIHIILPADVKGTLDIAAANGIIIYHKEYSGNQDRQITIATGSWQRGNYIVRWQAGEGNLVTDKLILR